MSERGRILVGTASWSDPGFVEHWYPRGMRAGDRLGWYAQHFELVEVNSTFYAVPDPRTVERWCANTPDEFIFDVKLHQLFSRHSTPAKLLPPELQRRAKTNDKGKIELTPQIEEDLARVFLATIEPLRREKKLGALLLQLSPAFSPSKHRLEELDQLLTATRGYRVAIEFRNRNWVTGDQFASTIGFLKKWGSVFVNVDAPAAEHFTVMPSGINEVTTPGMAYVRLHGRDPRAYLAGKTVAARFNYDYSAGEVEEIADRSTRLAAKAREVHVVFNNNALDYAPKAAARLRSALGQMVAASPRTGELF